MFTPPERINTHAGDDTGTPLKVLVTIVSRCQTPKRINTHSGDGGDDTHTRLHVLVNIIPCCPPSEKIKRQNGDDEDDTLPHPHPHPPSIRPGECRPHCQPPERINTHSGDDGDDTRTPLHVLVNIVPCCPPAERPEGSALSSQPTSHSNVPTRFRSDNHDVDWGNAR